MKTTTFLKLVPALLGLSLSGAMAQSSAVSPSIGFNKVTIKSNSDTHISAPFHRKPVFTGIISGVPTDDSGGTLEPAEDAIITVAGNPLEAGTLAGSHYVRFTSGGSEGFYYEIAENTTNTITIIANGDDLTGTVDGTGIADQDGFTVIEHWTFISLFPEDSGVDVSTSRIAFIDRGTELLLPSTAIGVNKSASVYYLYKDGDNPAQWEQDGVAGSLNDEPIPPGSYLILRHTGAEFALTVDGRVPDSKHAIQLDVGTGPNDNFISISRPVDTTLNESGLGTSGAFEPSTSLLAFINRGDELLVVDNEVVGFNKAATIYFFYKPDDGPGKWLLDGDSQDADRGADQVFKAGQAVIIRKKGAGAMGTEFFVNSPPY